MSYCVNGQQNDYAWWTDEAESYSAQLSCLRSLPAMSSVLRYGRKRRASGPMTSVISPVDRRRQLPSPFSGPGTTAEWIAEDPGEPTTEGLYPFADFGSVTFTDLGLTVPSGSWTVPPYSDAVKSGD